MAFCRIIFSILVLSVVNNSIATSPTVPVFMWRDGMIKMSSNALSTVTKEGLNEKIKSLTSADSLYLFFVEETLSVEDYAQKDIKGDTPFTYLQSNLDNSIYLPAVIDPIEALETLTQNQKIHQIDVIESESLPQIPTDAKYVFINLKDAKEGESRVELLRRHNNLMEELVDDLQAQNKDVFAIYTGRYPSWVIPESHSRVRRQLAASNHVEISLNNLLLDATSITIRANDTNLSVSQPTGNSTFLNGTDLSVTLSFENNDLALNFVSQGGYWIFDKVILTQTSPNSFTAELLPTNEVYAIDGFSYRCGQTVVFINKAANANVTFSDLQIQAYFSATGNATENKYGDEFNCVGFFTVPIWSGLFVVFILLTITFYGIMMMMDIRTMDRFDDPKGKTITINAGE